MAQWPVAHPLVDPNALLLLIAANATPVIIGRLLGRRLEAPVDAGTRLRDGRPLFGAHKTWRGLASALLAGAFAGALLPCGWITGLGFAALAMAGDLASSFLKRRLRRESGHSQPLLDQLPESLLPLIVFAGRLELDAMTVLGSAALFTVLDMLFTGWRSQTGGSREP